MKVLDIGSGKFKVTNEYLYTYLKDFIEFKNKIRIISVDKYSPADINYDLDKIPWEFAKSNEYDIVFASHFLEHASDLVSVMKEIHRVLKPQGLLFARLPHFKHKGSFRDPTHKHFISYETFEYFEKNNKFFIDFGFHFKILKRKFEYHDWQRKEINLRGKVLASTYGKFLEWFANKLPFIYEQVPVFFPIPDLVVIMKKI
ncbi:MAG: class I SAM-dependent methyltransferase [Candidatus Aenigmatarchaeota archaeon]